MKGAVSASLVTALGLVLLIEGLVPLVSPRGWRSAMQQLAALRDGQVRFVALAVVLAGGMLLMLA